MIYTSLTIARYFSYGPNFNFILRIQIDHVSNFSLVSNITIIETKKQPIGNKITIQSAAFQQAA